MMTDARHDSTSNAYHTTVTCLSVRYKLYMSDVLCYKSLSLMTALLRLWGYAVSREEHTIAQTRELVCTKKVLPEVISRTAMCIIQVPTLLLYTGQNVVEVAHNIQHSVSRYIIYSLALVNTYDTWHGEDKVEPSLYRNKRMSTSR